MSNPRLRLVWVEVGLNFEAAAACNRCEQASMHASLIDSKPFFGSYDEHGFKSSPGERV